MWAAWLTQARSASQTVPHYLIALHHIRGVQRDGLEGIHCDQHRPCMGVDAVLGVPAQARRGHSKPAVRCCAPDLLPVLQVVKQTVADQETHRRCTGSRP